jgi:hypothetical protein
MPELSSVVTPEENRFLDVFLREATTAPFTGPATKALHKSGLEYGDISYIAWVYEQEVHRTSFAVGHVADIVPPLPWPNGQSALRRNEEKPANSGAAATGRRGVGGTE